MRLPILVLHICGGIVGLLSGTASMSFRKGSRRHRLAGNVFVASMLCVATAGAYLAFMKSQAGNVLGGVFTFYLVSTAWVTGRRRDGVTGILDWVGLIFALAVGVILVTLGVEALSSRKGLLNGVPVGMCFFMAAIALLCAAGDARMLLRGGVFRTQRLARHLWRMCFGLFIATGSFFLGQQQVFPAWLRGSNVLLIPALLPLGLLIFWLVRVRFTNAYGKISMPREGDVYSLRTKPPLNRLSYPYRKGE